MSIIRQVLRTAEALGRRECELETEVGDPFSPLFFLLFL
jgi:hypothetical protein